MRKLYKFAIVGLLIIVLTIDLATGCKNRGEQKREQSNVASEAQAEKISTEEKSSSGETEVIAYYFYTNFRCQSCYTVEKYTKEAIESNFEDELSSGKLVFKPTNIEAKENEHFINDYQLYTKSVVLSLVKDGKEVRFKNLNKVWELLMNKENFFKYIEEETRAFLYQVNGEGE